MPTKGLKPLRGWPAARISSQTSLETSCANYRGNQTSLKLNLSIRAHDLHYFAGYL